MNFPQKDKIIQDQIRKKIEKLAKLEKELNEKQFRLAEKEEFKITRKIYACYDGFIIVRTFSKNNFEPFQLSISTERMALFIQNRLPCKTKDNQFLNLYKLLKNTIGIDIQTCRTVGLGNSANGITIGDQIEIDGFQLIIRNYDEMNEVKETLDDINFTIFTNTEIKQLEIENTELKNKIEELNIYEEPLIIAEGKTDWKYFISGLKHFHSNNEYTNIKESWFLKFGTDDDVRNNKCGTNFKLENSVSNLNKILDSFIETRNIETLNSNPIRVGIFDSDHSDAKTRNDLKNKVYSFLIEPKYISSELLFSDSELKTLISGRRLYFGNEFDEKTGQLIEDRSITLGNANETRNKAGKNKIIDSSVFNSNGVNIALSKEEFAISIFFNEISINSDSWNKFRHIFNKIDQIVNE